MKRSMERTALAVASAVWLAWAASAPAGPHPSYGALLRVRDLSGNPLSRASIRIATPSITLRGIADERGEYFFAGIPPGHHTLAVSSAAHEPFERVVTFRPSTRDTFDVYLDVPLELRGAKIRMAPSGDAYVNDRLGNQWIHTREGTRWIGCRGPDTGRQIIEGIELADPLFGRDDADSSAEGTDEAVSSSEGAPKARYSKDCNYNGIQDVEDKATGVVEDNNRNGSEDLCDVDPLASRFVLSDWRKLSDQRDTSYASVRYELPARLRILYTVPIGGRTVEITARNLDTAVDSVLARQHQHSGAYMLEWAPINSTGKLAAKGRYELRASIGRDVHIRQVAWRWN